MNGEPVYTWKGPLQPYAAFHSHYSRDFKWTAQEEFIVPRALSQRFRIVVERGIAPSEGALIAYDLGRDETLAEQGIWSAKEDAEEFGLALWDTLFQYCNEYEMQAVADHIAAYIAAQNKYRAEHQLTPCPSTAL
jgi:hypothetical protein